MGLRTQAFYREAPQFPPHHRLELTQAQVHSFGVVHANEDQCRLYWTPISCRLPSGHMCRSHSAHLRRSHWQAWKPLKADFQTEVQTTGWRLLGWVINTSLCLALSLPSGVFARRLMTPSTQTPKWLDLHVLWGPVKFTVTDSEMSALVLSCWGLQKDYGEITHPHTKIQALACVHSQLGNTRSNFASSSPCSTSRKRKWQRWTSVWNCIFPYTLTSSLAVFKYLTQCPCCVSSDYALSLGEYQKGKLSVRYKHHFSLSTTG